MVASPDPADFQDPAYREAVVDLLGAISYGEISAFERLADDATMAPSIRDKVALASMAAAELGHVFRRGAAYFGWHGTSRMFWSLVASCWNCLPQSVWLAKPSRSPL